MLAQTHIPEVITNLIVATPGQPLPHFSEVRLGLVGME